MNHTFVCGPELIGKSTWLNWLRTRSVRDTRFFIDSRNLKNIKVKDESDIINVLINRSITNEKYYKNINFFYYEDSLICYYLRKIIERYAELIKNDDSETNTRIRCIKFYRECSRLVADTVFEKSVSHNHKYVIIIDLSKNYFIKKIEGTARVVHESFYYLQVLAYLAFAQNFNDSMGKLKLLFLKDRIPDTTTVNCFALTNYAKFFNIDKTDTYCVKKVLLNTVLNNKMDEHIFSAGKRTRRIIATAIVYEAEETKVMVSGNRINLIDKTGVLPNKSVLFPTKDKDSMLESILIVNANLYTRRLSFFNKAVFD